MMIPHAMPWWAVVIFIVACVIYGVFDVYHTKRHPKSLDPQPRKLVRCPCCDSLVYQEDIRRKPE